MWAFFSAVKAGKSINHAAGQEPGLACVEHFSPSTTTTVQTAVSNIDGFWCHSQVNFPDGHTLEFVISTADDSLDSKCV